MIKLFFALFVVTSLCYASCPAGLEDFSISDFEKEFYDLKGYSFMGYKVKSKSINLSQLRHEFLRPLLKVDNVRSTVREEKSYLQNSLMNINAMMRSTYCTRQPIFKRVDIQHSYFKDYKYTLYYTDDDQCDFGESFGFIVNKNLKVIGSIENCEFLCGENKHD